MISRLRLAASAATIAIIAAAPFSSANAQDEPPILLTMEAPGGGILSDDARIRNGKIKDKDPNLPEESILFEDGYDIYFRLAAPNAEAVHKWRRTFSNNGPSYDVLVLTDPDQCLDLSHTVPSDLFPAFTPMSLEDCNPSNDPDYEPDETFINFHIDQFDAPRVRDSSGGYCRESVRERLVDDEFGAKTPMESNKTYVDPRFTDGAAGIGDVFPVGPNTGGFQSTFDPTNLDHEDCYGFGTDDDLPSLVVMANVGASRISTTSLSLPTGASAIWPASCPASALN